MDKTILQEGTMEQTYFEQQSNFTRYYIDGKGVCITSTGDYLWFDLPAAETSFFSFDEPVLHAYLSGNFSAYEQRALALIQTFDQQARELNLHVVATINQAEEQSVIFYSEASQAYFELPIAQLDYINLITANQMAQSDSCTLANPHRVHITDAGVLERR